ncbi:PspC domain-containing protein [Bifidobacterium tissieri]|uniref:PspC domain-containing protein n=1 Tax=Bifidobacterium tissieri TaxID=1630162 RepID=A0A5M9ZWJ2_9BIFI|nr:PspC domain-containing protein [Bifidobacterium tissieri]KAA8829274.1 PspC domain-containing protein [Bifidobacterium tissieri]KAA8831878.1 PspC domain-containing protein [Bifidobacterium tissieri]
MNNDKTTNSKTAGAATGNRPEPPAADTSGIPDSGIRTDGVRNDDAQTAASSQSAQSQPTSQHNPLKQIRFFRWVRASAVERSPYRWIGGVCSGIAYRIGVSELLIRAIFVAACCFFGVGAVVYALAWLILPDGRTGRILLQDFGHAKLSWPFVGASALFWTAFITACSLPSSLMGGVVRGMSGFWMFCIATAVLLMFLNWSGSHAQYVVVPSSRIRPVSDGHDGSADNGDGGVGDGVDAGRPASTVSPISTVPPNPSASIASVSSGASADSSPMTSSTAASSMMPRPTVRRAPRRRPAGFIVVGVTCGLLLISLAGVLLANAVAQTGPQDAIRNVLLWVCAAAVGIGATLVVLGFLGRKSGGLLPIAALFLVAVTVLSMSGIMYAGTFSADESHYPVRKTVSSNLELGSGDDQMQMYRDGLTLSGERSFNLPSRATINLSQLQECPTGTIHLHVEYAKLVVRMPRGCSFLLGNESMGYMTGIGGLQGLSSSSPWLSQFTSNAYDDLASGQVSADAAGFQSDGGDGADGVGGADGADGVDSNGEYADGDAYDLSSDNTYWSYDDTKLLRIDASIHFASVEVIASKP